MKRERVTMRRAALVMTAIVLAAATQPATLGPPSTGTMYNGNNAHPPNLQNAGANQAPQVAETKSTTGAQIQGGRGAAHGGGG